MRFRARACSAVVVAVLTVTASAPGQTTRDSAGIRIITFDEEKPNGRIVLSVAPSIDIGSGNDPRTELHQVGDIRLLRDGTLVIANRGTGELKFFARDGRFLRSISRKGSGPGEFQSLTAIWITRDDSIVAADGMLRRFIVFDGEGRHGRTVTIETPPNHRPPRVHDFLAPNLLLGGSSDVTALPARMEPYYFTQVLYALDLTGRVRSTIGAFGEGEHFVQVMDPTHPERGNSYWNRAFGREMTIRSLGNLVAIGDGQTLEVRLYTPNGGLARVLRGTQPPPSVTTADIAAFKKKALESAARSPMTELVERMVAEMPFPDRLPAYERFESDPQGRLWLKRYSRPSDSTEVWAALAPDGSYFGPVELPPRTRLRTVTDDAFLCVWRDSDDVERVRKHSYQLVAAARGSP